MPKIEWKEDFSVHNEDIDSQHKKWLNIYNKAHDQMISQDTGVDIGKEALKEMIEYGKYHFAFEESYMEKIGFPEIEVHKKLHNNFIKELDKITLQMHRGKHVLASEIIKMIENWLFNHILNEDKKYARWVK